MVCLMFVCSLFILPVIADWRSIDVFWGNLPLCIYVFMHTKQYTIVLFYNSYTIILYFLGYMITSSFGLVCWIKINSCCNFQAFEYRYWTIFLMDLFLKWFKKKQDLFFLIIWGGLYQIPTKNPGSFTRPVAATSALTCCIRFASVRGCFADGND